MPSSLQAQRTRWRRNALFTLAVLVSAAAAGVAVTLLAMHVRAEHSPLEVVEVAILVLSIVVPAGCLLFLQAGRLDNALERMTEALDERRRTDMAMREAEARLRNVLEGSGTGILIHRDLRPLFVNAALVGILGYESAAELMRQASLLDLVAPHDRDRMTDYHADRLQGLLSDGSIEVEAVRKDGRTIRLDVALRPIMWGGEPVVFVSLADVTERRRAEEALRLSEARLSRAQRIAHLGNWERHFGDGSLWWSDEVYAIFGRDPSDFQPTYDGFVDCVHPDDRETVKAATAAALAAHDVYSVDHRIVLPDGAVRHVHEQGEFRYDEVGQALALVGTVHDITERKLTEQRLRDSEMRHRDFAADVAHELRTPLSVMRAHLDNLGEVPGLIALREDVATMSRLVEQLLAASRAEMLTIGPDDVADLHAVAVSVATHMAPLGIQDGRLIEVAGEERNVRVRGSSEALQQAVRNLVENAIKYSRRGSPVTIQVAADPPSIAVVSLGQTIRPENRDAIFTRFTRADQRGGGAGLGLSIVRRIVDAHGGTVTVRDPEDGGVGAVFVISVPAASDSG